MLSRIIIHIGAPKCGSSAIQEFLASNSDLLRSKGFIVPDVDLSLSGTIEGHQVWLFEKYRTSPKYSVDELDRKIAEIDLVSPPNSTLIISAENLHDHSDIDSLFSQVSKRYPLKVIFYIRRQDDFLISAWKQWYSKIEPDLWAWLIANVATIGNWRSSIERWERIVGRTNMVVRIYERSALIDGNVVIDFLETLGLSASRHEFVLAKTPTNRSLNDAIINLLHASKVTSNAHDTSFEDTLKRITHGALETQQTSSLINYHQRTAILYVHAAGNAWIRHNYFTNSEHGLFTDILTQRHLYEPKSTDKVITEQLCAIMIIIKHLIEKIDN